MSVKAMAAAWDLECPKKYGDIIFRPSHKLVLLSYTDHADHYGRNIFPAVATIAKKTGFDDRTVQRLTDDLESVGLLIPDGRGPRGTNKFHTPILDEGWQPDRGGSLTGGNGSKSLGDIPSGDIPSGGAVPPDLKNLNQKNIDSKYIDVWNLALEKIKSEIPRASFETWVQGTYPVAYQDNTLWVGTKNSYARDWLSNRITDIAQKETGLFVGFMVIDLQEAE